MQALFRSRAQTVDHAVRVLAAPRAPIRAARLRLENLGARMQRAGAASLATPTARLAAAARELHALDPRRVVGRGFAIVRDERGAIVTHSARVDVGAMLDVELAAGALRAQVQSAKP
jgi:exodeoxyribonuclease VII large subunit